MTMEFNGAMKFRFCHGPFEYYPRENGQDIRYKDKVRDHDHLTGTVRGAAHSSCNLRHHKTLKIPIFFLNFRGYDAQIIAAQLENIQDHPITVIGQGMEKYLTLSLDKILFFKDRLQFLGASLEIISRICGRVGLRSLRYFNLSSPMRQKSNLTSSFASKYTHTNRSTRGSASMRPA